MNATTSRWTKLKRWLMRAMPMNMTCRELDEAIVDYLDGSLPRYQKLRFKLHLRICRLCRRYLEVYRWTIAQVRGAYADKDSALPPDALQRIVDAAARERTGR